MARVTGPLHSDTASGTFAKSMTFSRWKGRPYVRERVIPANPKAPKQLGVRAMMAFLAQAWASIGASPQSSWLLDATAKGISAFNEFISANLKRWQNFQGPTKTNPATEASTGLTVSAHVYTGGIGQVNLSLTASGSTNIWGIAILRSTSTITAADWTQCVAILPCSGAGPHLYVDSPLAAGTYHYRALVINDDGKIGTVLADDTATVT